MRTVTIALLSAALLVFAACSDDSDSPSPDTGGSSAADTGGGGAGDTGGGAADAGAGAADAAGPQKPAYPAGPYGTQIGSTVENFEFEGFFDAKHLCKDAAQNKMDLTTVRKISFADFYNGGKDCPKKKFDVLWVMVSAGWCGPCHIEVKDTQAQYGAGHMDKRVALLNLIYQDDSRRPADTKFVKLWARNNSFQLSFPVAADPTFQMGKYFDKNAVPFNMLIDLRTMKMIFRQTGANLPAVGRALFDHLAKLDKGK